MDIEILADQWEEQQQALKEIEAELLEDGEEVRIFTEETKDELPF
jgi:leucyl aminopeptidase (aminopeptidase T)|tara:strand:- start:131 stop:265 length:135 start_codon:yes stop_codon:yes gene_type:complete